MMATAEMIRTVKTALIAKIDTVRMIRTAKIHTARLIRTTETVRTAQMIRVVLRENRGDQRRDGAGGGRRQVGRHRGEQRHERSARLLHGGGLRRVRVGRARVVGAGDRAEVAGAAATAAATVGTAEIVGAGVIGAGGTARIVTVAEATDAAAAAGVSDGAGTAADTMAAVIDSAVDATAVAGQAAFNVFAHAVARALQWKGGGG